MERKLARVGEGLGDYCADMFKVLSNPCRLQIVNTLIDRGQLTVSELCATIQEEQSLVSHHLRTLREAGFVVARRDGKFTRYSTSEAISKAAGGNAIDLGCCSIVVPSE